MKKIYFAPSTMVMTISHEANLLSASNEIEGDHQVTGDPTNDTNNPLTPGTGETSTDTNPFGGHGSGTGGSGNRAKMWDDTWDLPQWWNF